MHILLVEQLADENGVQLTEESNAISKEEEMQGTERVSLPKAGDREGMYKLETALAGRREKCLREQIC